MSKESVSIESGKKSLRSTGAETKEHKPAKHIEETARLASSVETDKNPKKVQKAKNRRA